MCKSLPVILTTNLVLFINQKQIFEKLFQIDVKTEQLCCTKEELIHNPQYWKQYLNIRTNTIQRQRESKAPHEVRSIMCTRYSVLGHVNQTLAMKMRRGEEVLTPHFLARRPGERNTEIDYSRTQLRVGLLISYLWGRWGSGDDRTKRNESVPVREREEQEHAIKMRKCHLFLRSECTDHGWSGSDSPSCRRSAPFPAPSMLHSSFHHTTGLPLLFPSSPLLTHSHTLAQPTAAQEVCRTTISAGECRGKRSLLIRHHRRVHIHTRSLSCCKGANTSL